MKKMFPRSRFWNKLFLTITVSLTAILLVFSPLVYKNTENTLVKLTRVHDQQVMAQMGYNIELMNSTVRDVCMTIFLDAEATSLMYRQAPQAEIFKDIQSMEKVANPYLNVNPYIHSIYLYNGALDTYYSSYNGIYYEDTLLQEYLQQNPAPSINRPVYRQIAKTVNRKEVLTPVFTYILHDTLLGNGRMEAAVIINVNPEWIMSNLSTVNEIGESIDNYIFLQDPDGNVLATAGRAAFGQNIGDILAGVGSEAAPIGATELAINGEDHYVTYLHMPDEGWTIYKVQPLANLTATARGAQVFIIITTAILILLSVALALALSRGLYKPIGNLVEEVAKKEGTSLPTRDEIGYLQQMLLSRPKTAQESLRLNTNIYKSYAFRMLLLGNGSYTEEETSGFDTALFAVDLNEEFLLALVKVDQYTQFAQRHTPREIEGIFYAIGNVLDELVGALYPCDVFDLQNNNVVLAVGLIPKQGTGAGGQENDVESLRTAVEEALAETQRVFAEHYAVSLTVGIAPGLCDSKHIRQAYAEVQQLLEYRFLLGGGKILTGELAARQCGGALDSEILAVLQQRLPRVVNSGDASELEALIEEFIGQLAVASPQEARREVTWFTYLLQEAADNYVRAHPGVARVDITLHTGGPNQPETLAELAGHWVASLQALLADEGHSADRKQQMLAETVAEILEKNYQDPGFNLAMAADIVRMSPVYVGRIFKAWKGASVAKYLTAIRIEHAAELLRNTRMSVKEVMDMVGYENESTFYKHFKEVYGVTPKTYVKTL